MANKDEVAVMGTYNSGCAKIEVPTLEQAPGGGMLMVSHANTNPGLTKAWDPGEPDKYYPAGTRNYARVITTDDYQGSAAAQFAAQDLKVKNCFIINDNETYGQGVAQGVPGRGDEAGHQHPRQHRVGRQAAELHGALPGHQGQEPRLRVRRAASSTTTVASSSRTRSRSSATTTRSS